MPTYSDILDTFAAEHRLRHLPPHRKDSSFVDLTSNDYMGLAARAHEWMQEFHGRFPHVSMTSSASRLLATDQAIYTALEASLAYICCKSVLLFNSGYHANTGIVASLGIPGTLLITDRLVHASIIDGVRLSKTDYKRFGHNDVVQLEKILEKEQQNYDRMVIICESIYSMDGDSAPLQHLVDLKKKYPKVMLYVDEAHAVGAIGPYGAGLASSVGVMKDIDILVGTFGKAVASQGAFAAVSEEMKSYLINTARSFIFSTALPPANAAWTLMMLEKLRDMEDCRSHLSELSTLFRKGIEEITGKGNASRSAIVPLLTGNAENAVALSGALEKEGILALPIRRPTVPPGGERIRFSLTANLQGCQLQRVLEILDENYRKLRVSE